MYNCVIYTENEVFSAQAFYYNKENHYLNYFGDGEWQTIHKVDCEIGFSSSLIIIHTKSL